MCWQKKRILYLCPNFYFNLNLLKNPSIISFTLVDVLPQVVEGFPLRGPKSK